MRIQQLNAHQLLEFKQLIALFNEVFEQPGRKVATDAQLARLLANPDFFVLVALQNGQVVGGLTVYLLQQYTGGPPLAYIYDLAVAPHCQGQGLGSALIAEVRRLCTKNGYAAAYVEAEQDDAAALQFYRRTPFHTEVAALHFTYLPLRAQPAADE